MPKEVSMESVMPHCIPEFNVRVGTGLEIVELPILIAPLA
jgi:hypothetical protein